MSNYGDSQFKNDPNTPWYRVLELIRPNTTVLDYGCSSGNFGKVLINEKGCTVDGVELDEQDAKTASTILRNVYRNNIEIEGDSFLGDEKYDYIYLGDVIEHLINPVNVLSLLKARLNSKGRLVFSIPNMAHMSVRLMLLRGNFTYGETGLLDKTHLHFYDQEEIRRVLNEAGYEVETFDYVKRDIPREVLTRELEQIGLFAKKKFLEDSKNIGASAYQYICAARPVNKTQKIIPRPILSPPINEMEKHIEYMKSVHSAQIKSHKNRIKELEANNIEVTDKLESTQRMLNEYTERRTLRVLKRIYKSVGLIR